jgi:integrase
MNAVEAICSQRNSTDELQGLLEAKNIPPRDRAARQYVIDAFTGKMPRLIQFSFENESILKLATYLLRHTIGSKATLYQYVFGIYRFSKWIEKTPDEIIQESQLDKKVLERYVISLDDFVGDLQAEALAPGTIVNHVKGVKALYRTNGIQVTLPYRLPRRVKYSDRAPTPEELTKMMDIADIREKVVISLLALGGFRLGTLVNLKYRHVKKDLEAGRIPLHVHVEAEITKGKYHDYETFLGAEAVEYLKVYLDMRRKGTRGDRWGIPPEVLCDESPLIRDSQTKMVKPVTTGSVYLAIHKLYVKAGLIQKGTAKRYDLRAHSIRKYFRTQLGSLSTIPTDYIEYMMGHTISTYNDVKMKGIEYLRNLYASCGLSIRPKAKISKIDQLKLIIEAWGLNPNEILSRDALTMPHATVVDAEQEKIEVLNQALKQAIIKELQKTQNGI